MYENTSEYFKVSMNVAVICLKHILEKKIVINGVKFSNIYSFFFYKMYRIINCNH